MNTISDDFDALYQRLGNALILLDNDFALQALIVNGMLPPPLTEDITVFRGLKASLDGNDINAWFKYGIRAFSNGEYQKFLGYYVNEDWNKTPGRWELGGTYVSLEPSWAAGFAMGFTTALNAESILIEIRLPKGSPCVCGSSKEEHELIPSAIEGNNIVAIYKLDAPNANEASKYRVHHTVKNRYLDDDIEPRYHNGDAIEIDQKAIELYASLGCKDLPTIGKLSQLYQNYADFLARYTAEDHARDQISARSVVFDG